MNRVSEAIRSITRKRFSAPGAFCFYVSLLLVFGFAHWLFGSVKDAPTQATAGLADAIYFSVVTATTLGYGDLVPKPGIGRVLAASEVFISVLALGLLLNSAWLSYTDRLEADRRTAADAEHRRREAGRLGTYLKYVDTVYDAWVFAQRIVSNALADGGGDETSPRTDWAFPDLRWMFRSSMSTLNDFSTSAIEAYFDATETLNRELRNILVQFDLTDERQLYEAIIDMLTASDANKAKGALTRYAQMATEDNDAIRTVLGMMEKMSRDPAPEDYASNLVQPVVLFCRSLRAQTEIAPKIIVMLRMLAAGGEQSDDRPAD